MVLTADLLKKHQHQQLNPFLKTKIVLTMGGCICDDMESR